MKRVAVHGSYFGYNFGDTLLCALFCNWVRQSLGDVHVVLPLASRRNRALIGADSRGILAFLLSSELVLCGGGYFGDSGSPSLKWSVRNYFRHFLIAELAILLNKKVYILGTGVGPISSPFLRKRLRRIADAAQCIVVRDQEASRFLKEIGVSIEPIVDMDAALYLTTEFFEETAPATVSDDSANVRSSPLGATKLAIHLSDYGAEDWSAMADVIVRFCATHKDVRPVLITDSKTRTGKAAAQDKASRRLEQLLPAPACFYYGGDPRELCRLLDEVDLIVTNKLHVGIVSTVLGKDVISLPQHVKTPRFYRQIGMSEVCVTQDRPKGLDDLLRIWAGGNFPRFETSSRPNIYLDVLHREMGSG